MYEALIRHGLYLPSIKSGICTEKYLMDISMNQFWCPTFSDIRLCPCPRTPTKKMLIEILSQILVDKNKALHLDSKHLPNKAWILVVIGTLDP